VACIVQAGPQFDANGEVPEKCSHFSQPLVFLRSSRRRILCNDFFLESNSIYRFVKKGESFQDLERFNAVSERQCKQRREGLEICGEVIVLSGRRTSPCPARGSHGHVRLTNLCTQRIQLSKHACIHPSISQSCGNQWCRFACILPVHEGVLDLIKTVSWGFTTSTYASFLSK